MKKFDIISPRIKSLMPKLKSPLHKAYPKLFSVLLVVLVIFSLGIATGIYHAVKNTNVKGVLAREAHSIKFPGVLLKEQLKEGCGTASAGFSPSQTICSKQYIVVYTRPSQDYCVDFNAIEKSIKDAGYNYTEDTNLRFNDLHNDRNYNVPKSVMSISCSVVQDLENKGYAGWISYSTETKKDQQSQHDLVCRIGTIEHPFNLDQTFDFKSDALKDRSSIYGCVFYRLVR